MNPSKNAKRTTAVRVLKMVRPYRVMILAQMMLALVNVACSLYVPILIGRAIDNIISVGNVRLDIIGSILIQALIIIGIGALAQYALSLLSNRMTYSIVKTLREDIFGHIWKLPLKYMDSHPAGDIISRVVADCDQLADGLLLGFTQLFSGVATILGTLCFMVYLNVYIAIVVVVVTPLSFFVAKFIATHTYDMFKKQSEIRGRQTSQIEETLSQVKVVRAYSVEEQVKKKFNDTNDELKKVSLMAVFYSSLTNPSTRFVNSIVYALVALTGAFTVINGGMTVGIWSCFLNYANQYTKPFNEITGVITELQGALACAQRVFEILDEDEEAPDAGNAIVYENVSGDVRIENVDFSYTEDVPLIENLSLDVKRGQRIAIVGPTGSGKTTLINLLMRFYDPVNGSIFLDDVNLKNATRDSLRESFGMVLQDTWLRNGTIAENICIGKPGATREEIVAAAKETHAHSFIRRLEKGYDTIISEEGDSLSAGQKQLLCITRIMLKLPPMLILDEATSSIDTMTELQIQNAFAKLMEGKTSFIVAHRLSTIVNSDLILVMRDGKVIEQGTHTELMNLHGFYAELFNTGIGKISNQS